MSESGTRQKRKKKDRVKWIFFCFSFFSWLRLLIWAPPHTPSPSAQEIKLKIWRKFFHCCRKSSGRLEVTFHPSNAAHTRERGGGTRKRKSMEKKIKMRNFIAGKNFPRFTPLSVDGSWKAIVVDVKKCSVRYFNFLKDCYNKRLGGGGRWW